MVEGHERTITKLAIHIERSKMDATTAGDTAPTWKPLTDFECELPARNASEGAEEREMVDVPESHDGVPGTSNRDAQPSVKG